MRTVDAGLFELLREELIEEVERSARPLIVTKDGRPVVELRPLTRRRADSKVGHGRHGISLSTGEPNGEA